VVRKFLNEEFDGYSTPSGATFGPLFPGSRENLPPHWRSFSNFWDLAAGSPRPKPTAVEPEPSLFDTQMADPLLKRDPYAR
jgi:hypothetical protein